MAVTIIKKEVASKQAQGLQKDTEFMAHIEKMAQLEADMAPMKASLEIHQKDYAKAEKAALNILAEEGLAEEKYDFSVDQGMVSISAVPNKTEVTDEQALYDQLEQAEEGLFAKLAKVALGDMKKYLGEKTIEKFTKTFRSGKRRVKITLEV